MVCTDDLFTSPCAVTGFSNIEHLLIILWKWCASPDVLKFLKTFFWKLFSQFGCNLSCFSAIICYTTLQMVWNVIPTLSLPQMSCKCNSWCQILDKRTIWYVTHLVSIDYMTQSLITVSTLSRATWTLVQKLFLELSSACFQFIQ